jgi:hypothetical protein
MQPSRANARGNNSSDHYSVYTTAPTTSSLKDPVVYPSRPPRDVEQKRQQRLQRQKDISNTNFYRRSTSESQDEVTHLNDDLRNDIHWSQNSHESQQRSPSDDLKSRRPVLQRQQRQQSVEAEAQQQQIGVHFKKDPEYFKFEAVNSQTPGPRRGTYDPLKQTVHEEQRRPRKQAVRSNATSLASSTLLPTQQQGIAFERLVFIFLLQRPVLHFYFE